MSKRFYKHATATPRDEGFVVELDGRPIKTPAGSLLVLPTRPLAEAVAAEWDAQGDDIDPKSMKLMPLAGTALDRVPDVRDGLVEGLLRYATTDLLCHRASHPADLAARQHQLWQPLLDWAAADLGARLVSTEGVIAQDQPQEALDALRSVLQGFDDWALTALGELVGLSGSLVVGLALAQGRLTMDEALVVSHVDEDHQRELWGEDFEATARRKNVCADMEAAYRFFQLSRP